MKIRFAGAIIAVVLGIVCFFAAVPFQLPLWAALLPFIFWGIAFYLAVSTWLITMYLQESGVAIPKKWSDTVKLFKSYRVHDSM